MSDTIKNIPNYAKDMEFIVVRRVDGELWFFGGYDRNADKAFKVAKEIDGIVVHNLRV